MLGKYKNMRYSISIRREGEMKSIEKQAGLKFQ